jgi:ABC-type multidrug transport system fused ATPase/permease subunit
MTQTLALLLDAYRELNARKMFWISLIISGLVMVGFGLLGLNDKGLTLLWFDLPVPAPRFWYKYAFSVVVVGIWVSWAAMVLALISTASIFPDLLASGSIDLYLSKPISRVRLFLTKYMGGLLFVVLQATVFAVGSFIVFGLRAGQWRPSLFLIIPLATLLFSYLFSVCVLVGIMTRSTIAAILITCLFWVLCFITNKAEQALFVFRVMQTAEVRAYERQARLTEAEIEDLKKNPSVTNVFGIRERRLRQRREKLLQSARDSEKAAAKIATAHRIVRGVATVVPKTGETVDLLDRKLFSDDDLASFRKEFAGGGDRDRNRNGGFNSPPPQSPEASSSGESSTSAEAVASSEASDDPAGAPLTTAPSTTAPTTSPADSEALIADSTREMEQRRAAQMEAQEEADRAARSRSIPWILGTSVAFEAIVLSIAAWVFCRRDY